MQGIEHILSPMTTPWTAWVMLALMFFAFLAEIFQPGVILQSFATIFSKLERTYNDSMQNFLGQLMIYLFRTGVLAMTLYLIFYQQGAFKFGIYALVMAMVLAFDLLKVMMASLVNFTFNISKHFSLVYQHYSNVWTVICCVLYPIILITLNIGMNSVTRILLIVVVGVGLALVLVKWIRIFFSGLASLWYIVLYFMTVEILPLGVLAWGVWRVVKLL